MAVVFSNNAKTTLASNVSTSATSITVADGSVFPALNGADYTYVTLEDGSGNVEIVKVTALSSNVLTVVRAQDNTSARAFSSGDKCELRLTAAGLNEVASQADTDTNTTYSVGDGGLTQINFTSADNTKLDGIATSANNYSHPSAHAISFITGLQTALDGKVDDSQVLTNVPANALFTDTDTNTTYSVGDGGLTQINFTSADNTKLDGIAVNANNYTLPFTDNSANWNTAYTYSQVGHLPLAGGTLTGNLTVSKTSPTITLYDTNTSTGHYPTLNFDTDNDQGVSLVHNEFDGELPAAGYGLVLGGSASNTQFPTTGTLSFVVRGEIYAGSTTVTGTNKVWHEGTLTTTNKSNYDTAYGWGNHASAGYVSTTGNQNIDGIKVFTGANVTLDNPVNSWKYIRLQSSGSAKWDIATREDDTSGALQFRVGGGSANTAYVTTAGNYVSDTQGTLYGSSNDGSGSGLDADLLDGQHASAFLGVSATASKAIKLAGAGPNTQNLNTVADSTTAGQLEYRAFNTSSTNAPPMSDNANGVISVGQHSGNYGAQLAFSSNGNMYWRDNPSTSFGSWRKVWDSGNDGSGSGLDADLLDGADSSVFFKSPSNVSGWLTNDRNFRVRSGGNAAGFLMEESDGTFGFQIYGDSGSYGFLDAAWGNWDIQKVVNSTFKVDEGSGLVRVWNAGNDGSGSGLDADLLDGLHATSFASSTFNVASGASNSDPNSSTAAYFLTNSANAAFGSLYSHIQNHWWSSVGGNVAQHATTYNGSTARFAVRHRYSGTWTSWAQAWTQVNDGSGSGLDADLLDGLHATSFVRAKGRANWNTSPSVVDNVVGQLGWKNYSNNHTIFDASASTTPSGTSCSNADAAVAWTGTYPTLMGYNGSTTYGVRVDSARNAGLLDGLQLHTGRNNVANKVVRTNSSGYLDAGWINTTSGVASGTPTRIYCSQDSYLRYYTPASLAPYILNQGSTKNSHTHSYLPLSGGTLTGTITAPKHICVAGTDNGIGFWGSTSDYAIQMGNNQANHGTVTDYSMHHNMGVTAGRGFTFGNSRTSVKCSINAATGAILSSNNITAYSDIRVKDNIEVIPNALDKVSQLSGYTFTRTDVDDKEQKYTGVIAQEVLAVLPEAVQLGATEEDTMSVAYGNMVGLLIESIKELKAEVDDLKTQLENK